MDEGKFIGNFKEQFINASEITVDAGTDFRQINTWDSLTGMAVLVMIKDEYAIDMTDANLKKCKTVGDIIDFVRVQNNK